MGDNSRPLGLTKQHANSEIKVFPNPAHNHITISYASLSENTVSISLYDYTGKLVKTFDNEQVQKNNNEVTIDVSNLKLSGGIYFIKTNANNKTHTQKIVIE